MAECSSSKQQQKKLKIQDLKDDVEGDTIRAIQENEQMLSGSLVDATPFIENHDIHIYQHKKFANSDAGQSIKLPIMQHITKHNMLRDAEMNPGMGMPAVEQSKGKAVNVSAEGEQALMPGKEGNPSMPSNIM